MLTIFKKLKNYKFIILLINQLQTKKNINILEKIL